jgi:hypothetical protein
VLPDVFPRELVERPAVQRRRELAHAFEKARIARRKVPGLARPAKVEVERLRGEDAFHLRRQRGGSRPVEVVRRAIPHDRSVGEHDEESLARIALVPEPFADLHAHPFRRRGGRRGHEDEMLRVAQRIADGRPERGGEMEARRVAEHTHRAQTQERLREPVQRRLQQRRELSVSRMAVGDERFVRHDRREVRASRIPTLPFGDGLSVGRALR